MKKINTVEIITYIVVVMMLMVIILVVFMCLFTPEKTDSGMFTNPIKYWMSDAYVCENFKNACKEISHESL